MPAKTIKMNGVEYDIPTKDAVRISYGLAEVWKRLGYPPDIFSVQGEKMMENIIHCWHTYFPDEAHAWYLDRKEDLDNERSMSDSAKAGGYTPIAYPGTLFQLIRTVFPGMPLGKRHVVKKIAKKWPLFKTTKYSV